MTLIIITAIISWLSFIFYAVDRRRQLLNIHGGEVSTGLLATLAIIAPVGALGGLILFSTRSRGATLWLLTILGLVILFLLEYFFRA